MSGLERAVAADPVQCNGKVPTSVGKGKQHSFVHTGSSVEGRESKSWGECARAHTERQNHAGHSHSLGRRLCTASPVACVQLPSVTGGVSPIPDSTNQNLWGRVHCCPGTCADTELEMLPLSTRPEPSRQLRPFTRKARLQAPGRPGHPGVCLQ